MTNASIYHQIHAPLSLNYCIFIATIIISVNSTCIHQSLFLVYKMQHNMTNLKKTEFKFNK